MPSCRPPLRPPLRAMWIGALAPRGWALSPSGLVVSWKPCCLGTDWPAEHLAFVDCLQLGKLPKAFYWETDIFARLLISLLCLEFWLPLLLPCGKALLGSQGGGALERVTGPLG